MVTSFANASILLVGQLKTFIWTNQRTGNSLFQNSLAVVSRCELLTNLDFPHPTLLTHVMWLVISGFLLFFSFSLPETIYSLLPQKSTKFCNQHYGFLGWLRPQLVLSKNWKIVPSLRRGWSHLFCKRYTWENEAAVLSSTSTHAVFDLFRPAY
jgi:hypothetical protein